MTKVEASSSSSFSKLSFLAAAAILIGSSLLVSFSLPHEQLSSLWRHSRDFHEERQLLRLAELADPKSVEVRTDRIEESRPSDGGPNQAAFIVGEYSLENTLRARKLYRGDFVVIIYDPQTDKFIPYSKKKKKAAKTMWAYQYLVDRGMLRLTFPERFHPSQPEFAVAIGGGDYPNLIYTPCIMKQEGPCVGEHEVGPILQFGSVFKAPVIPSMMAMPMPMAQHLRCFSHFSRGDSDGCYALAYYGKARPWEDLIPQVVWRGTDFTYLNYLGRNLAQPNFERDIEQPLLNANGNNDNPDAILTKEAATRALRNMYDRLLPRWKGVVWTAEAEVESEQRAGVGHDGALPWANIKFSRKRGGNEVELERGGGADFDKLEAAGINAIGEYMNQNELAQYRYHIDIGGGGGTTWTGTVQKLALPGLLFHHESPTKDYIADWIIPWTHYVPVREDLLDLKEKYEWAENNPDEARRISENATRLMRALGTRKGFEPFFDRFFREPLRRVIEAYQPLGDGVSWRDVLAREEYNDMQPTEKHDRTNDNFQETTPDGQILHQVYLPHDRRPTPLFAGDKED